MTTASSPRILVVGSIGIDTIETPYAWRESVLGGSASFACVAASYFSPTAMVGVVGTDFPAPYRQLYLNAGIDLDGLQVVEGKTFRWSGIYESNMDNRHTRSTELNVLEKFSPDLPERYKTIPYIFLGNISPALQNHVLNQVSRPAFVMMDTMDLWIKIARPELERVIQRVHLLTVNDSEARLLTGETTLPNAARALLKMGPRYILIKRGESGSMLFSADRRFLMPAYPLDDVVDPTGAGDTFAGAFLGALAEQNAASEQALRKAMLYGSVVAAFGVQDFSLDRLTALTRPDIETRAAELRAMMSLD